MFRFLTVLTIASVIGLTNASSAMAQDYVGTEAPSEFTILNNLRTFERCVKKDTRVLDIVGVHGTETKKTIVVKYGKNSTDNFWDNGKVSLVRFDNSNKWLLSCFWGDGFSGSGTAMRVVQR